MSNLRVLLVDDHDGFLKAAARRFRPIKWIEIVGQAINGLEAVRLAESMRPHAVLMDLSMPEMGGLQACRLLKAQDNPPFVAIVSHFDDAQHREHAARAGADTFVSKLTYMQDVVPILETLHKDQPSE
ncbi:MAG: two-component system response regulator [Gammaproteobacteria bacterium HGW-Gammaproteobacteria-7]|nr:MAG: two-component system response regulator [Gammaproteobacteria bacterium HGW-Gammaproteobacteria-7]